MFKKIVLLVTGIAALVLAIYAIGDYSDTLEAIKNIKDSGLSGKMLENALAPYEGSGFKFFVDLCFYTGTGLSCFVILYEFTIEKEYTVNMLKKIREAMKD